VSGVLAVRGEPSVILDVVDPRSGLRLLLGSYALKRAADILARQSAEAQRWAESSRRTDVTLPARAR
jgi:hypothetical protein